MQPRPDVEASDFLRLRWRIDGLVGLATCADGFERDTDRGRQRIDHALPRQLERLGNPALLRRLLATVDPGKRLIRALLAITGLLMVVLAMMRPQYGGKAQVTPTGGLDIVIAVDYSKSMLAKDIYPSRSERLEAELTRFLDESGRRSG